MIKFLFTTSVITKGFKPISTLRKRNKTYFL